VAGFLLVAAVWGVTAWGAAKTWRFVRQPSSDIGGRQTSTRFGLLLGATLGLAAIAFHSVVDFNMYIPANALLMVWLLAVVNCQLRFATERHWVSLGWLHKLPASALLLAAVGAIGWQSTRHAGENYWRARAALIADPATPAKARDLERALAWEPANDETAGWLGEVHRLLSEDRGSDYVEQARQAIHWFDAARHLNPLEARWELGRGWCLDWIDREAESSPAFSRGEELDPNGYFTMNQIGLHYMQTRDYAAAQPWFERSAALYWLDNPVARSYLDIIERNLLRAATNAPGGVFEPGVRR
jgi:tetratricopeptide (TPR) repeat protein